MTDLEKHRITLLREKGYGYIRIANELGISVNTIKSFCRRNITHKTEPILTGEITSCENCGQEIRQIAKQKRKRFCCDKCRNAWWNKHLGQVKRKTVYHFTCPQCGKEFHIYGDKRRKYCSHDCYIADRFKGGASRE